MHDLTFSKEIISFLIQKANSLDKGLKITAVNVSLSKLSHVTPETLKEAFSAISKDTPFSGIELNIKILGIGIKCGSCKEGFVVDKPTMVCPSCHSSDLNIIYSREFNIESIEVAKKGSKRA